MPFGGVGCEHQRQAVGAGGVLVAPGSSQKVGPGGVEGLIALQHALPFEVCQRRQARVHPIGERHGDRPVERDDRGRQQRVQLAIQRRDLAPIGGAVAFRGRVRGADGRLNLIGAGGAQIARAPQKRRARLDLFPVP